MNLQGINSEIISSEFQLSDATSQINLVALDPEFKGDTRITEKSKKFVGVSIEINKKLIGLLEERGKSLEALLPVQKEEVKPDES